MFNLAAKIHNYYQIATKITKIFAEIYRFLDFR